MHNIFRRTLFIFVPAFLITCLHGTVAYSSDNSAKKDIAVKDYTWKTSGMGRVGILKDITLKNLSLNEYKNIQVEIDLYSRNGNPAGSLRATLKDTLPAGSEKTYYNVNLGIMSVDLVESTAKIVSAEEKDAGPISKIGKAILVKDVKFKEAQYGTEGFIESVTLQNNTNQDYKNVTLKISDLGVSGAKAGYEGYVTKATINKVLPANSTVTVKEINVGFTHPDAKNRYVVVSDATPVSKKELRYLYSEQKDSIKIESSDADLEKEKKLSLVERYRQELRRKNIEVNSASSENSVSNDDIQFSIEEEIEPEQRPAGKEKPLAGESSEQGNQIIKVRDEAPEQSTPEFQNTAESSKKSQPEKNTEIATSDKPPAISGGDIGATEVENTQIQSQTDNTEPRKASAPEPVIENNAEEAANSDIAAEDTVESGAGSGSTGAGENVEIVSSANVSGSSDSDISGNTDDGKTSGSDGDSFDSTGRSGFDEISSEDEETAPVRTYDIAFGVDEVPLPKRDIVVKDFSWGSGVPGTLGKLRDLTLENISTITYTDIDILVEYFSPQGTPLGSSQFILKDDILKPGEIKKFRNINVGLVQLIPDESSIKISVRTAKDIY